MAPSLLILVRHGQSEHHVRGLTGGWTDTPLTELGHRQAMLVAERLGRELGDVRVRLYTSDLLRAGETCRHIAKAFGVEPVVDARLREFNNGDAINMTIEEAKKRFPKAWAASIFASPEPVFPNGETGAQFMQRCGEFIESLGVEEGGVPVLVTHGGTIMAMVAHWLGLPPEDMARLSFAAHPTSITTLRVAGHEVEFREVERLNDAAHLVGQEGYVSLGAVAG